MVKVQQWLENQEEYSTKEKRSQAEEIYLTEPTLEGELDLKEFTFRNGIKVYIYPTVDDSKLTFTNQSIKVIKLINVQEHLDNNYLQKKRSKTILDIRLKKLTGPLIIDDFINLEIINCFYNKLTSLNLTNCPKLRSIYCYDNNLNEINISSWLNLTGIWCENNQLTNLSIFSKLVNLKVLNLGNNPLNGSLKPLQDLSQLKVLNIKGTTLAEDLEYLPEGLNKIICDGKLAKQLKDYKNTIEHSYNYCAWRKDNEAIIPNLKRIIELEELLANLHGSFTLSEEEIKKKEKYLFPLRRKMFINYCWLESELLDNNTRLLLWSEITTWENLIKLLVKTETNRKSLAIFIFETQSEINSLKAINEKHLQTQAANKAKIELPPKSITFS